MPIMNKAKAKPEYYNHKKWYEKRNREMYLDRQSGMNGVDLVSKYKISATRLYAILRREENANKQRDMGK